MTDDYLCACLEICMGRIWQKKQVHKSEGPNLVINKEIIFGPVHVGFLLNPSIYGSIQLKSYVGISPAFFKASVMRLMSQIS